MLSWKFVSNLYAINVCIHWNVYPFWNDYFSFDDVYFWLIASFYPSCVVVEISFAVSSYYVYSFCSTACSQPKTAKTKLLCNYEYKYQQNISCNYFLFRHICLVLTTQSFLLFYIHYCLHYRELNVWNAYSSTQQSQIVRTFLWQQLCYTSWEQIASQQTQTSDKIHIT